MNEAVYPLFGTQFSNKKIQKIDLSDQGDLAEIEDIGARIEQLYTHFSAPLLYGGYLEKRSFYSRSNLFANEISNRDIHLGMDYWTSEGIDIFLPYDAILWNKKDNQNYLDYGPTLIFKLLKPNDHFSYMLFGHLSKKSLTIHNVNDIVFAGTCIGSLGNDLENGQWPPHLHLQLMKVINSPEGDYPGLCDEKSLSDYKSNCPEPLFPISI
jgi:murein DD-endopeptidase MepM/ murein hydrolase activator NlpD